MELCLSDRSNLLIPFWIHFCFNLSLRFFEGDVGFFAVLSILYVGAALLSLRFVPRDVLQKRAVTTIAPPTVVSDQRRIRRSRQG